MANEIYKFPDELEEESKGKSKNTFEIDLLLNFGQIVSDES